MPRATKPGGGDRVSWFEIGSVWVIGAGAAFDPIVFFDDSVGADNDTGTPKKVLKVERTGGDLMTFVKVMVEGCMELTPLPPLLPTLTLTSQPKIPPDLPPDPSISMLFPENTYYRIPNNPFRGPTSSELRETCKNALHDALKSVRGPFIFNPVES